MTVPLNSLVAEIENLDPDSTGSAGQSQFWEDVYLAGTGNGKIAKDLLDLRRTIERRRPAAHRLVDLASQLPESAERGADLYEQLTAPGGQLDTARKGINALAREERARLTNAGVQASVQITDSLIPELLVPDSISVPSEDGEAFTYWLSLTYVEALTTNSDRLRTNLRPAAERIFSTLASPLAAPRVRSRFELLRPTLTGTVDQVAGERLHGHWLIRECRAAAQLEDRRRLATTLCYGLRSHIESVGEVAGAVAAAMDRHSENESPPPHPAHEPSPHPDGPGPGGHLWWQGQRHEMPPLLYALCKVLWNEQDVQVEDTVAKVWGDESDKSDNSLKCALRRLNNFLAVRGVPWWYSNRGGSVRRKARPSAATSESKG